MRKVILQMTISIVGVATVRGQGREDPELKAIKLGLLSRAGCHIMGRTTYEEMRQFWPYSDDAYAAPMNDLPKVVFSRTITEVPWETSRIACGDLAEEIDALKHEPGGDIIAWGGASFAQALIAGNLIDEYRLLVNPVIAGEGLSIFKPFAGPVAVELTEAQAFESGAVLHVYTNQLPRDAA
jgi:dihydrofolate reductase